MNNNEKKLLLGLLENPHTQITIEPANTTVRPEEKTNAVVERFKDYITVLGGVAAVGLALLWYFGRREREGYFAFLRIPISQLNLSIWDYVAVSFPYLIAWLSLVLLGGMMFLLETSDNKNVIQVAYEKIPQKFRFIMYPLAISFFIVAYFLNVGNQNLQRIFLILILVFFFGSSLNAKSIKTWYTANYILILMIFVAFILLVTESVGELAEKRGDSTGNRLVTEETMNVEIVLNSPILSDSLVPRVKNTSTSNLFAYHLYFLRYNDNHYFLFSGVDSECRPDHVYIVKDVDVLSIEYTDIPPLKHNCIPATPTPPPPPTVSPTPTPLPAAMPTP